eukprot:6841934-Pyramimonas_sp.AAC.1
MVEFLVGLLFLAIRVWKRDERDGRLQPGLAAHLPGGDPLLGVDVKHLLDKVLGLAGDGVHGPHVAGKEPLFHNPHQVVRSGAVEGELPAQHGV